MIFKRTTDLMALGPGKASHIPGEYDRVFTELAILKGKREDLLRNVDHRASPSFADLDAANMLAFPDRGALKATARAVEVPSFEEFSPGLLGEDV